MRTAVDTNVIAALWSQEPSGSRMAQWLGRAQAEGGLVIAAAVYVELLAHPGATRQFVDEFLISSLVIRTEKPPNPTPSVKLNYTHESGRQSENHQPRQAKTQQAVAAAAL